MSTHIHTVYIGSGVATILRRYCRDKFLSTCRDKEKSRISGTFIPDPYLQREVI